MKQIQWHELDKSKFYVIGPSLFLSIRTTVYPAMLIKTRLQIQRATTAHYKGTMDAFRKIYRAEGIRGFYKGFFANTLSLVAGQLYITSYETVRYSLPSTQGNFQRGLIAGASASVISQTATVPIDVISQILMVQGHGQAKHSIATSSTSKCQQSNIQKRPPIKSTYTIIVDLWKQQGLRGFYRGYLASLITNSSSSGIWWGSYGAFTNMWTNTLPKEWSEKRVVVQGLSGSCAATMAVFLTNPIDVIRTRLQVEGGKSIRKAAKTLYQEEGINVLRKGITARLMASLPTSVVFIVGYETVKRLSLKEEYRHLHLKINSNS